MAELLWVFDRTLADLTNNTDKAFVNYVDLNRIETRMQELSDSLNSYTYLNTITTKTDWQKQTSDNIDTNIPFLHQLIRIMDNEQKLIDAYYVYSTTPPLPKSLENIDYSGFNNIEKILYDLHLMIQSMIDNFRECDTFYCGE